MRVLLGARLPAQDPAFRAWVRSQEKLVEKHWPWYAEEMHGVAEAINGKYEDVLLLNLRAWQYADYGKHHRARVVPVWPSGWPTVTWLAPVALDDPIEYYCGPVHVTPDTGYRFITFPITGTSWGNRGMNNAGLSVGSRPNSCRA